jgi:hypothetical protein
MDDKKTTRVVFADRKQEDNFRRLASSTHPEDRKTFLVLRDIRRQLQAKYVSGREIPTEKIPDVYRRLFHLRNLWSLDLPPHGRVLYSLVGDEIRIVDII